MKTPLWTLLLLCLCDRGRCDCQRDCLTCSFIRPQKTNFNMLACLVECESKDSPGLTWESCHQSVELSQITSMSASDGELKRADEEVAGLIPVDQRDGGVFYSGALQRFDHVAQALGRESRTRQLSTTFHSQQRGSEEEEEEEEEEQDMGPEQGPVEREPARGAINLTKRFGGFLKNKYGYRKLMDPGRSLQKRYGGFIGIRKSARKWNNQKRFSEFLKQYLGTRASEFNSVSADITQQNEV